MRLHRAGSMDRPARIPGSGSNTRTMTRDCTVLGRWTVPPEYLAAAPDAGTVQDTAPSRPNTWQRLTLGPYKRLHRPARIPGSGEFCNLTRVLRFCVTRMEEVREIGGD
jgi:hypothetical protein